MAVKFPLNMADGIQVRTLEELREHFDLGIVLEYYASGRLDKWLKNGYYDKEAEKIRALDSASNDFKKSLCDILSVPYLESDDEHIDLDDIAKRNERRRYLRQFTDDDKILAVDNVAFTQDELDSLLNKGTKKIYLCGKKFILSGSLEGITYIGVNNPTVEFDAATVPSGVDIVNVEFDIIAYVEIDNYLDEADTDDFEMNKFRNFFANNFELGLKLLRLAAEKEIPAAQIALGLCYLKEFGVDEDWDESARWFQKAAEQGWFKAQIFLNLLRQYGIGVDSETVENVKLVQKLAKQGDAAAQYQLGICCENGFCVMEDGEEAAKWFRKAAEQGHAKAQYELGECYWNGIGVEENEEEAVKWYLKAVEQGDADAQYQLGKCYCNGIGVEENEEEGVKWFRKAAEQGHAKAQEVLEMINN